MKAQFDMPESELIVRDWQSSFLESFVDSSRSRLVGPPSTDMDSPERRVDLSELHDVNVGHVGARKLERENMSSHLNTKGQHVLQKEA